MASVEEKLAALRHEIDTVDHQLHDLLMKRCDLAVEVGKVKAERQPVGQSAAEGAKFIRPAREALILRRLVARHSGKLPRAVIVRLWRELISALLQVEGPFAVAVFAPESEHGFWDIARDHYGSRVAVSGFERVAQVLGAVQNGQATVGILPIPGEDDPDPWWRHLIVDGAPHVMGRLPFGEAGNHRGSPVEALVIGQAMNEPTGKDRSLLVIKPDQDISRNTVTTALAKAGLTPTFFARHTASDTELYLVEVDGFLAPGKLTAQRGDAITAALMAGALAQAQVTVIGSYAIPFTAQELATPTHGKIS